MKKIMTWKWTIYPCSIVTYFENSKEKFSAVNSLKINTDMIVVLIYLKSLSFKSEEKATIK